MMKSPFKFGQVVEGEYFTDRAKDIKRLVANFENNINTVLLSPRRWGKSSLVHKAIKTTLKRNKNFRACYIDLFQIRDEKEFYGKLATGVIKSTSTKFEDWVRTAGQFLKTLTPNISFGIDPQADFKISFDFTDKDKTYGEILNLPEKIAKKKKIKIIIAIDEFQNLSNFKNPLLFQKRLRSAWQYHYNTVYCLFGSKRHMLTEIFENKSMPFYKFGDVIYLSKIEQKYLVKFIIRKFEKTSKHINGKYANEIVALMKRHPYYVQQLAYIVWSNTGKTVDQKTLDNSVNDLLDRNSILYEKEIDELSNTQVNFLKALVDGIGNGFSSQDILKKYNLGASSNVIKIKRVLLKKEIIDISGGQIEILDPAFELWLRKRYFAAGGIKL